MRVLYILGDLLRKIHGYNLYGLMTRTCFLNSCIIPFDGYDVFFNKKKGKKLLPCAIEWLHLSHFSFFFEKK